MEEKMKVRTRDLVCAERKRAMVYKTRKVRVIIA